MNLHIKIFGTFNNCYYHTTFSLNNFAITSRPMKRVKSAYGLTDIILINNCLVTDRCQT